MSTYIFLTWHNRPHKHSEKANKERMNAHFLLGTCQRVPRIGFRCWQNVRRDFFFTDDTEASATAAGAPCLRVKRKKFSLAFVVQNRFDLRVSSWSQERKRRENISNGEFNNFCAVKTISWEFKKSFTATTTALIFYFFQLLNCIVEIVNWCGVFLKGN